MNYQAEALNWVKKHGLRKDLDFRTVNNALNIIIHDALLIAESHEDLNHIELTKSNLKNYLT